MRLNKNNSSLLLSLLSAIIFSQSCIKDQVDAGVGVGAEARITKVVFDSSYVSVGFNTLNYSGDTLVNIHQFDSIHKISTYINISYPAQNQIKIVNRATANLYTLFIYDDNKLAKIEKGSLSSSSKSILTFHSSNNKIDSITGNTGGVDPKRAIVLYKYDTKGNIIQVIRNQNIATQLDTIYYSYDATPNLYEKNQLYFLIEYTINTGETETRAIPCVFSKNNMTSIKTRSYSNPTIINYKKDSKSRMTDLYYNQYDGTGFKYYY